MATFRSFIRNQSVQLFVLIAVSAGLYLPALRFSFVWDDRALILENWFIRDIASIPGFFTSEFRVDPLSPTGFYRPLVMATYAVDYALWGENPMGFHLSNLLFNALVVVLAFLVIQKLAAGHDGSEWLPFVATLIFAVHPAHMESVAFISGRTDVLASLFLLLALWLYLHFRQTEAAGARPKAIYVLSHASFLLGLFSKEIAVALLVILPLYEFYLRPRTALAKTGRSGRPAGSVGPAARPWRYLLPYLIVLIVYLAMRAASVPPQTTLSRFAIDLGERLSVAAIALLHYIQLALFPAGLKSYYIVPLFKVSHPLFWVTACAYAALAAALVYAWRKAALAAFATIWFLVALSPSLKILPFPGSDMADRYLYLPTIGSSVIIALALIRLPRKLLPVGAILLTSLFLVSAISRLGIWKDEMTLFSRMVMEEPRSVIAHNNLGRAFSESGQPERGFQEYYKAIQLDRRFNKNAISSAAIHLNVGLGAYQMGQYQEAIKEYRTALAEEPNHVKVHYNLAMVYADLKMHEEAEKEYKEAIRLLPWYSEAHNNLGVLYKDMGRLDDAAREYREAIRYYPKNFEARYSLAVLLENTGNLAEAAEHYRFFINGAPKKYAPYIEKARQRLDRMTSIR